MSELNAAVAAAALGSEERFRELLRSVVEVARAIFAAKASSILLLDEEANELVFEAVVGEGEEGLLGQRFPAGTGVAGWVLATRTPLVIEDVARDPRFAKDVAEGTGYVPQGLMAVPLLHDERALGVLEVLDRQSRFTLAGDGAARALRLAGGDRARPAPACARGRGRPRRRRRPGGGRPARGCARGHRTRTTARTRRRCSKALETVLRRK